MAIQDIDEAKDKIDEPKDNIGEATNNIVFGWEQASQLIVVLKLNCGFEAEAIHRLHHDSSYASGWSPAAWTAIRASSCRFLYACVVKGRLST
jgi:hypothetical protein